MDVKEKLVELLGENTCKHDCCEDCEHCEIEDDCTSYLKDSMADHLIANGVTVQEWISVDDRLPKTGGYVVCIAKRNPFSMFMPMVARIKKNGWVNPMTEQYISEVTHWMPMQELPKGE